MEPTHVTRARARSRDEALRLLQKLTVGSSIAAVVGVGVFAVVSAQTIPGTAASSSSTASTTTSGDDSTSSSSNNSSNTIQSSSGISSTSSNPVAVTGGSR